MVISPRLRSGKVPALPPPGSSAHRCCARARRPQALHLVRHLAPGVEHFVGSAPAGKASFVSARAFHCRRALFFLWLLSGLRWVEVDTCTRLGLSIFVRFSGLQVDNSELPMVNVPPAIAKILRERGTPTVATPRFALAALPPVEALEHCHCGRGQFDALLPESSLARVRSRCLQQQSRVAWCAS